MDDKLQFVQHLIEVSTAIIETPALSVNDFGIQYVNNELIWTGNVSSSVNKMCPSAALTASSAVIGKSVIIGSKTLGSLGFAALTGAGAAASGIPIIGWISVAIIATCGISRYREAKKQQQEKERMYREIIKKQQAAITRQKEKIAELQVMLQNAQTDNGQNSWKIKELEQQVANLKELIEILTTQCGNFEAA